MTRDAKLVKNADGSFGPESCLICGGISSTYVVVNLRSGVLQRTYTEALCGTCAEVVAAAMARPAEPRFEDPA